MTDTVTKKLDKTRTIVEEQHAMLVYAKTSL